MQIRSESIIRHPREAVYRAYRDHLPEIARRYMPDIKDIVVHERREVPAGVELHNEWISNADVPKVAAKFLRPEHLRWDDFATWSDEGWYVDWTIKTRAFTDAVDCSGRNAFIEQDPNTTVVRLSGELRMDLREVPGVPRFLAGSIGPGIEKFIVSMITPNLEKVNQSLQRYLDDQP